MLRGVVFVSSFVESPRPIMKYLVDWLPLSLLLAFPLPDIILRLFCLGMAADRELLLLFRYAIARANRSVLASRLKMIAHLDKGFVSLKLTCPILYLRAANDWLVPSKNAHLVQKSFPQTIIQDIPGPHFLIQAEPLASAQQIARFIYSLDAN